jgi:hypothetical protein
MRHDQQNKEKDARLVSSTSQSPGTFKKDIIKTVLELIDELHVQDSTGFDENMDDLKPSKTALGCKLAHVPLEIWMIYFLEAKKWVLNESNRNQLVEDKS